MGLDDKFDNKAEETKGKIKEGAGKATDDPDKHAQNRELDGCYAQEGRASRQNKPKWSKKIDVRRFLDFESFESETLGKNRLTVRRRHKAVASTQVSLLSQVKEPKTPWGWRRGLSQDKMW